MTHYWIGDSIGTSWWSTNPARDSPPGRLSIALKAAGKEPIVNLSVGGMGIHDPKAPDRPDLAYGVVDRTLPAGAGTVVIALGANDLPSHRLDASTGDGAHPHYLKMAMIALDALARSRANKVVWQTILPVCAGGHCVEPLPANMGRGLVQWYDVGPFTDLLKDVNGWMKSMWPTRVVDVTKAMRPNAYGWADPLMMFDGLHPNKAGCTNIADEFPLTHF